MARLLILSSLPLAQSATITKTLNAVCQQNKKVHVRARHLVSSKCVCSVQGEYCPASWFRMKQDGLKPSVLELSRPKTGLLKYKPSCESKEVQVAVSMGCCFSSMMQQSRSLETQQIAVVLKKCGGNVLPCRRGSLVPSFTVRSSFTMKGNGLTTEHMRQPKIQAGIIKSISNQISVSEDPITIIGISVVSAPIGRRRSELRS